MYGVPRGMMLNNPFNLRISSNPWIGKIVPSRDKSFEQFATLGDGIHAGLKTLCNYYRLRGCTTIAQIITRWAPESDNNPTSSYIDFVAKHCGVDRNNQFNVLNAGNLCKLAEAIIEFEQGDERYVYPATIQAEADKILKVA